MRYVPKVNHYMKRDLYDYDIFPKVFLTGKREITIKPLGIHTSLKNDVVYKVYVKENEIADEKRYANSGCTKTYTLPLSADGCLRIQNEFEREGLYLIQVTILDDASPKKFNKTFRVYALDHDMKGRYPYRGDLHVHSCRSDGREDPIVVASNYRGFGYDFMALTDHHRYYPSLDVRNQLRIKDNQGYETSDLTDMLVSTGEEVQLPYNDLHYINFGGRFSINAIVEPSPNDEPGEDVKYRSLDENAPKRITSDEYFNIILEKSKDIPLENEAERMSYASAQWIYENQKKAGGIGIFPHPYWMCPTMQVSQKYLDFLYKNHPFDAFEVLGGESYYQQNGFQTAYYYEQKAKGFDYPIVGSTDSHNSTEHNSNALICSTIVFANSNTTNDICKSIKEKYSVAVDTISEDYRLVGDFRWVKFGSFLMEEYYPLHDLACKSEGYYLNAYFHGDQKAEQVLLAMKGQIPAMISKYFDLQ